MAKKKATRETKPEDLKKVGVQKSGLARQAADKIAEQKKRRQKLLKEI